MCRAEQLSEVNRRGRLGGRRDNKEGLGAPKPEEAEEQLCDKVIYEG